MDVKALDQVTKVLTELQQLTDVFSNDELNKVPFEGSWTAGQVGQHMIMSNSGFANILTGPTRETDRAPDEKVKQIEDIFLDFSTKLKSPENIVPPKASYNKGDLLHDFEDIKLKIQHAASTLDLTETCEAFKLPAIGFLTRLEAIYFVVYHTQRHIHQLKKIGNLVIADNHSAT